MVNEQELNTKIEQINEDLKQLRPLTEEELAILFLSTMFEEEGHECK
ncbi:MAG: hypothetical protein KAQ98_01950 [Bacteriovoracaceae bacterium]|nr:hypothetical protein [Bacteriovoracaceae bacterium]